MQKTNSTVKIRIFFLRTLDGQLIAQAGQPNPEHILTIPPKKGDPEENRCCFRYFTSPPLPTTISHADEARLMEILATNDTVEMGPNLMDEHIEHVDDYAPVTEEDRARVR